MALVPNGLFVIVRAEESNLTILSHRLFRFAPFDVNPSAAWWLIHLTDDQSLSRFLFQPACFKQPSPISCALLYGSYDVAWPFLREPPPTSQLPVFFLNLPNWYTPC